MTHYFFILSYPESFTFLLQAIGKKTKIEAISADFFTMRTFLSQVGKTFFSEIQPISSKFKAMKKTKETGLLVDFMIRKLEKGLFSFFNCDSHVHP